MATKATSGYKIGFIGLGNVGGHLAKAFAENSKNEILIFTRSGKNLEDLSAYSNIKRLISIKRFENDLDFLFVTVNDDQISKVVKKLIIKKPLVLHTSGSVALDALKRNYKGPCGVFYPLQSFRTGIDLNYNEIPVLIEASKEQALEKLQELALTFSEQVVAMNSQKRKKLHLAAVVVNNFTNHLFNLSNEYLSRNEVDFNLLYPLICETANRLNHDEPKNLQTGPAKRGDQKVMQAHLKMLTKDKDLEKIYKLMSSSITKKHKH